MELLDESESRAFSSFLDSFATTSASQPPRSPVVAPHGASESTAPSLPTRHGSMSTAAYASEYTFARPPAPAPTTASWAEPGPSRAGDHFANPQSGRPWGLDSAPPHPRLDDSSTMSFAPPPPGPASLAGHFAPPAPPLVSRRQSSASHHIQQQQQMHPVLDPDAAKQRKLQHAHELEQWMAQSRSTGPAQAPSNLDAPSPPKRTRSTGDPRWPSSTAYPDEDPITAMLEAERKAGYAYGRTMNAAITRETAQAGVGRGRATRTTPPDSSVVQAALDPEDNFAVPPPPPPPVSSRSTRRQTSTSSNPAPDNAYPSHAKPKASNTTKPTSSNRKTSSRSRTRSEPLGAQTAPQQQHVAKSGSPSTTTDDPEAADVSLAAISPTPFRTPVDVPRPSNPPRPRPRPRSLRPTLTASGRGARGGGGVTTKSTTTSSTQPYPALLTVEQKKANHIASEQKRRQAIRDGYDGLCDVVPVLRDAVQEFEERVRNLERQRRGVLHHQDDDDDDDDGQTKVAVGRKKKRKGARGDGGDGASTTTTTTTGKTGALMGGINVGGEKIDGRAGPKSEAVVLSKTVDHVRRLLMDRASLLDQLGAAHARARQGGIEVGPAESHEWDEPWQGDDDDDNDTGTGTNVEPEPEEELDHKEEVEDEEMWEDE